MSTEGQLKSQVNEFLKISGRFFLRLNSGMVKSGARFIYLCPEGTADYLVCCPDPRWIELKAPKGTTKRDRAEKQQAFAVMVQSLGHKHLKATSLDEVIEFVMKEAA